MAAARSDRTTTTSPSLARALVWPGAISVALAAMAACGGSSQTSFEPTAGSGGSFGFSGSTSTTGGRNTGISGSSSASGSTSTAGRAEAAGGEQAGGDDGPLPVGGEPGMPPGGVEDAGGAPDKPGMPHDPPGPPEGMGGAPGADCPADAPADKDPCTTMGRCEYPTIACDCGGKEDERKWHCAEPPKPMTMCPPMPPEDASPCTLDDQDEDAPPPPPCHYEDAAVDCACTAEAWVCTDAPAP